MSSSLSWVKSLSSHNRDFLKLSDLPYELLFPPVLELLLVFLPLHGFIHLLVDLISELPILCLHLHHGLMSLFILGVYLLDDLYSLVELFFQVLLSFIQAGVGFNFHVLGVHLVLVGLLLLGKDGLLSAKLHLDLFTLDVVKSDDLISLVHFFFPSDEFCFIPLVPFKVLQSFLFYLLSFLKSKCFSLYCSCGKLHWSLNFVKIRHLSWLGSFEPKFILELCLIGFFGVGKFLDGWSLFSGKLESLLAVVFVLFPDGLSFGLSALLFIFLYVHH